jgi:hypothetical protein
MSSNANYSSYIPAILVNVVIESKILSQEEFEVVKANVNLKLFKLTQPSLISFGTPTRGGIRGCNIQFRVNTQNYKNNAARKEVEKLVADIWDKEVEKLKKEIAEQS